MTKRQKTTYLDLCDDEHDALLALLLRALNTAAGAGDGDDDNPTPCADSTDLCMTIVPSLSDSKMKEPGRRAGSEGAVKDELVLLLLVLWNRKLLNRS